MSGCTPKELGKNFVEKFCWPWSWDGDIIWKRGGCRMKKLILKKGLRYLPHTIVLEWDGKEGRRERNISCRVCLFFIVFWWEKRLASKIYLGPLPFYVLFTWLLGYFDLPSYGLESKNWYALRLLLMCLWGRDGCWRFEVVLPEGQK